MLTRARSPSRHRVVERPRGGAPPAFLGPQSLLCAWIVAIVTTAGSLYYSEHFHFLPCELCWYQRIVMYPLVVVLGVGWFRRDKAVWMTALPFVVIGAPLSLYHWLVERVPSFRREHVVLDRRAVLRALLREARVRDAGVDVPEQLPAHRQPAGVLRHLVAIVDRGPRDRSGPVTTVTA